MYETMLAYKDINLPRLLCDMLVIQLSPSRVNEVTGTWQCKISKHVDIQWVERHLCLFCEIV